MVIKHVNTKEYINFKKLCTTKERENFKEWINPQNDKKLWMNKFCLKKIKNKINKIQHITQNSKT